MGANAALLSALAGLDPSKLPDIELVRAEKARRKLHTFLKTYAWPVLQPGTVFVDNWHIGAICEHLEAVKMGQITRLIINMPFRLLKSTIVSQTFPAWEWIDNPSLEYLSASYSKDLATRDAVETRRIIESPNYVRAYGHIFRMTSDQNVKTRYENDKRGKRTVSSTDSAATGFGGNRILWDDPLSAKEASSEPARKSAIEWWKGTASTRLNNPNQDAVVVVHQRLHQEDPTGILLSEDPDSWVHLVLPMRYEKAYSIPTKLGFADPRTEEGELLCPERLNEKAVLQIERDLGSYHVAAQLQQRPGKAGGNRVKLAWFPRYRVAPDRANAIRVVQSWDTAKKVAEMNDYSVCTTWLEMTTGYYLINVFRKKMAFPELKRMTYSMYQEFNPHAVLIEDKASGTSLIQTLREGEADKPRLPVIAIEPDAAKEFRMERNEPTMEAGLVWLPESAPWLPEFISELESFPDVVHDDQMDSFTQFLDWVRKPAEIFIG